MPEIIGKTMTEEFTKIEMSDEIAERQLKDNLDKITNYWEGKHHIISLDKVIMVGKKYEDEVVVFLKDVSPQVYPLIKGIEEVNSFLKQLRIFRERL